MTVARLLGQRFLEKIQIHIRLIWVSQVKKGIQQFYWLIIYFGFNWGQSYLVTLVTPQNCTKMLRNVTNLLYNLHIFASDQKTFLFSRASFDFFWCNVWATFWEITGSGLENLEQLVESPRAHSRPPSRTVKWRKGKRNGRERIMFHYFPVAVSRGASCLDFMSWEYTYNVPDSRNAPFLAAGEITHWSVTLRIKPFISFRNKFPFLFLFWYST